MGTTLVILFVFAVVLGLFVIFGGSGQTEKQAALSRTFDPGPVVADDLNLTWRIIYRDREGERSERTIIVKSLHGQPYPKYALAFCHLRKEDRHFNLYNVEEAHDAETGEEVPVTFHLLDWIEERKS